MIHALKTVQPFFDDVAVGSKSFEIRKTDRPFSVGDYLALNEWNDTHYTGRFVLAKIVYILDNPEYVKDEYVILGIVPAEVFTSGQLINFDIVTKRPIRGYQVYGNDRGE